MAIYEMQYSSQKETYVQIELDDDDNDDDVG